VRFEQPALEATLADYLEEAGHVAARIMKLDKAIEKAVGQARPEVRVVIETPASAARGGANHGS
jgi:hypothetical protein